MGLRQAGIHLENQFSSQFSPRKDESILQQDVIERLETHSFPGTSPE